jgi:putative phosphoesterase
LRIVVVGDTHIPDFARKLPDALVPALRRADVIVHTGDVTRAWVLEELALHAPVHAALGNNDRPDVEAWGAADEVLIELGGVTVGMIHDAGRRERREHRLLQRFPDARVIVFGHSHIPLDYEQDGVRFLNPGSPTWKRRQPAPTYASISLARGRIRTEIVPIPPG